MIKKTFSTLLAVALMGSGAEGARAQTLTMEGLQNDEEILSYYNGGLGSLGSGGTNYGIGFLSGVLAGMNTRTRQFTENPSGNTVLWAPSGLVTANTGGFGSLFSLSHGAGTGGQVRVWSGLNGSGQLLGILNLGQTRGLNQSISFNGTAQSIQIVSTDTHAFYDDLSFGRYRSVITDLEDPSSLTDPSSTVTPEPITTVLLGTGLAGIAAARRRRSGAEVEDEEPSA